MKISAKDITEILPKKLRQVCQIGICNSLYLEKKKPVFCHCPIEYGGGRWSAKPSDVLPFVESIIVLIHFMPIAVNLPIYDIISVLADMLWRKFKIKTHLLDKFGRPDRKNFVGAEDSFLESTGYDARKKMLLLKELAYYAGLGQYGKNSLIVNRRFGSDFKIQALFTEVKLKYDKPILPKAYPGCNGCNVCIKTCPAKIIHKYKVISQTDVCRYVAKDKPIIIGRVPKKVKVGDNVSMKQKICCRICQSFCPANSQHYQNRLILVSKQRKEHSLSYITL